MTMFFCRERAFLSLVACVFSVLVLFGSSMAQAASASLYEVWIPVSDQSARQRQSGFQQGFDIVIKRLTGRSDVARLSGMVEARKRVSSLVSQFNYSDQSEAERGQPEQRYWLQIRFNEQALNRLLRENNLPLWGAGRPPVLVWMAEETNGRRGFIGSLSTSEVRDDINHAAAEWGIPLIYPLLDFEDANALSMPELWGLFSDPLRKASTRYGVNAIVAVRVWPAGNDRWNGRSLFMFQGQVYSSDFQGVTAEELSRSLVSDAAHHLSDFYAVASGSSPGRPVRLLIENINDVQAYARLMAYMDSLTAVRGVTPVRVNKGDVLLEVQIDGTMEQLDAAIGLGRRLSGITVTFESTDRPADWFADLQYRWR